MIAVDLAEHDSLLLDHGFQYAEAYGAHVWIVHVAAPDPDFVGLDVGPQYIRDGRAETLKEEHRALFRYAKERTTSRAQATSLLIQGPTIDTLRTELEKRHIDLLIMGAHAHGFWHEILFGHTAAKMLKDLSIPLLIIPTA